MTTEIVSVNNQGNIGSGAGPHLSDDGRFATFSSTASNFGTDTNSQRDVFVYDRQTDTIERVSVSSTGGELAGPSFGGSISGDGRYVTFETAAQVTNESNQQTDIFVLDRDTDTVQRVNSTTTGGETTGTTFGAILSGNGRFVIYTSDDKNIVAGDTNNRMDAFVFDRETGATERVSLQSNGTQINGDSIAQSISADGRYVTLQTAASNVLGGSGTLGVFVYDRQTDALRRVDVTSDGTPGDGGSSSSIISADGRYVTFLSTALNLAPGETVHNEHIYVYDLQTGTLERVDALGLGVTGVTPAPQNFNPHISGDGRFVLYGTNQGYDPADTNGKVDIYVYDRVAHTTTLVSRGPDGAIGDGDSDHPVITPDGQFVAFDSFANNWVPDDGATPDVDVFVVDRATGAGEGNDTLIGGADADFLHGAGGDDTLDGGDGGDALHGEAGNDIAFGGNGNDVFVGYDGADTAYGGDGNDTLIGDVGNDNGPNNNDTLFGGAGNDLLYGNYGDDTLDGGEGDDFLGGGIGNDTLHGGAGNDVLNGESSGAPVNGHTDDDQLFGESGADALFGGIGNDTLFGGAEGDFLSGGDGDDTLNGDDGDDALHGEAGNDIAYGGIGNDVLVGYEGNDTLNGDAGNDTIIGNAGTDTLNGGDGNDQMFGYEDADVMTGGLGDDFLAGGTANDVLHGDDGGDVLDGEADDDQLFGDAGGDNLNGNAGNDLLFGGEGNDGLLGWDGDDVLDGGAGNDFLIGDRADGTGTRGNDTFVFHDGAGNDNIADMQAGAGTTVGVGDVIDIRDFHFADFTALLAAATDLANGTYIQLDADDAIFLEHVAKTALAADDFLLT